MSSNRRVVSIIAILLLAPLALPMVPTVAAAAPGVFGAGTPTFTMYPGPADLVGQNDGEPSIGINHNTGAVMFTGDFFINSFKETRVEFDDSTVPATATWTDVTPVAGIPGNVDPILHTDPVTGRTWAGGLDGACSILYITDDDGESWIPGGNSCVATLDHETIASGPFHAPAPPSATYSRAVYYCAQASAVTCAASYDGGLTYPVVSQISCEYLNPGFHGSISVAPDGTAWIAFGQSTDHLCVAKSVDNGLTWTDYVLTPTTPSGGFDPDPATTPSNWVYVGYADGVGQAHVALSKDGGSSWSYSPDLGAAYGLRTTTFHEMMAGDDDRAALAFLGTTAAGPSTAFSSAGFPGVWHLYIAYTYDGGDSWTTVRASDDPVQRGCIWDGGGDNACRNLLDFNDAQIDEEGRVLVGFADGCMGACAGPTGSASQSRSTYGTIARQTTGKGLYAAFDTGSITVSGTLSGAAGSEVTLSATVSLAAPYDLTVNWGDGVTENFADQTSSSFTATHVYAEGGQYAISVSGVGSDSTTATAATSASISGSTGGGAIQIDSPVEGADVGDLLTVSGILASGGNGAPTAAFGASVAGSTASFDATASSDPEGDALAFAWAFGDGATGTGVTAQHTYATAGTYSVCLTASDGTLTDELCQSVTITQQQSSDLIAEDAPGDEADSSLTGSAVPNVDILKLEATRTASQEPVFVLTLADLTLTPPVTEGADGVFWMVEWTGPGGIIDYIQLVSILSTDGGVVQTCNFGTIAVTAGQRQLTQTGTAPCTTVLGANGRVLLTYPADALGARGYTASTVLTGVIGESGVVRGVPRNDFLTAEGSSNYDSTSANDYPLSFAPARWQDVGLVQNRMSKPAPTSPPANPEVTDTVVDPVGDRAPNTNIESAWFDADTDNLYVGLKVADIPADPTTTAFTYYAVNFVPGYEVLDPAWGSSGTFVNLRAFALYSPARVAFGIPPTPSSDTATVFELQVLSTDGTRSSFASLGTVAGSINADTDIIWWTIPRAKLQDPPGGGLLEGTSAQSAPAIGGVVTFGGILADTTGAGDSYAFPQTEVTPPVVTLAGTPLSGPAPLSVTFTGASNKPVATWTLSFGDGTADAGGSGAIPASFTHIYEVTGTYNARLSVLDTQGGAGAGQTTVNVGTSVSPVSVLVSAAGLAPVEATCGSGCNTWTADLDLASLEAGDVTVTATLLRNGQTTSTDSVLVQLVRPGSTGVVIDAPLDGATVNAGDVLISGRLARSSDMPPVAALTSDRSEGLAPLTVAFTLDGSDDHGIVSWRFTTGDGRVVDGTTLPATVSHTYSTAGVYHPTLDVVDTRGAHDSFTGTVRAQAANTPPTAPANPAPVNGATNVPTTAALSWTSTDVDGNTLTYDVYLDNVDGSTLLATGQTSAFLTPTLLSSTTYFWHVVAKDGTASTAGPVWSFTTAAPLETEADKPHVVVALIDSGINSYHAQYRRAALTENPSTYITGLPASQLTQIDLCFYDAATKTVDQARCPAGTTAAASADLAQWQKLDVSSLSETGAGQGQLAWFPGTNVMAISFNHAGDTNYPTLDGAKGAGDSHGTGTSSDVGGITTGTCPECIIVMIEGDSVDGIESAYKWAANQPWIDVISSSVSIGIIGVGANPAGFFEYNVQAGKTAVTNGKLIFEASGNGVANFGLAPTTTFLGSSINPYTVPVGCSAEGTGQACGYHDFPNAVTASGDSRIGANADTFTGTGGHGGTSFSAPSTAGVTARTIYALRAQYNDTQEGPSTSASKTLVRMGTAAPPASGPMANGALTRLELEEAIFKTARRPILPQVPTYLLPSSEIVDSPAGFVKAGYGNVYRGDWGVNAPGAEATWSSSGDAVAVLMGAKAMPNRYLEETWWEGVVEAAAQAEFGADIPDPDGNDGYPKNDAADASGLDGYTNTAAAVKPVVPSTKATVPVGSVPTPDANRVYLHHNNKGPDPASPVNSLIEYYLNSVKDPSAGISPCNNVNCPDQSGLGATGISTAGQEKVYFLDHPTLGGPVLLDRTKDVVIHVEARGFASPIPSATQITLSVVSGGSLVGTKVASLTPTANAGVYEARFKPQVDALTDPVELHVAWAGPAYSFHVTSRGASWMDLPIAATLPPMEYVPVTYFVDDFATDYGSNGDTVTLTRDATKLVGDADAGSLFLPQVDGLTVGLLAEDDLVTGDALLGAAGSLMVYPCTAPFIDLGVADYTVRVSLSAGGMALGGGSLTTSLVGITDTYQTGIAVPLTLYPVKIPKGEPIQGTIVISTSNGMMLPNGGLCGGGEATPIALTLSVGALDAAPKATIGALPSTLTGTVTLSGTATFPVATDVATLTWFAQDMDAWDTNGQTLTLETGTPGNAAGLPIFEPSPTGLRVRLESARPVSEDAVALSELGTASAQFWVYTDGAAPAITVSMTASLVGPTGARTLGQGSVTKHLLPALADDPVDQEISAERPYVINFVPQVTDILPGERLVLDVHVRDAAGASSVTLSSSAGGADKPVFVTLPLDVSATPTSPSVDVSISGLSLNAPVVDGAWSLALNTDNLANGAHVIRVTPKATYAGVERVGAATTRSVTVSNLGVNTPPSAAITLDTLSGPVPLTVQASVTGSDAQTAPAALTWSIAWGDGETSAGTGVSALATHTYLTAGAYTVSLTVTDTGGLFDTATDGPVTAFNSGPAEKVIVLVDGASPIDATDEAGDGSYARWGATVSLLDAGLHTVTARHILDGATLSETTVTLNVHIPDVPVVTILAPINGATVAPGSALTGTVDAQSVDTVTAYHGATSVAATTTDGFATFSVAMDALGLGEDELNSITIVAQNTEAQGRASVMVTLDGAPNPRIDVLEALPVSTQTDVHFQAAGTTAATNSPIASWAWSFGDGATSIEQNPTHAYARSGLYAVTLTVTDAAGASGMASMQAGISNQLPTATLGVSPASPTTADVITFTVAAADADGSIASTLVTVYDGLTSDSAVLATGESGITAQLDDGTYLVVARATDDEGATADDETLLVVSNLRPVAMLTASAAIVTTDGDVRFDATGSSDPDGTLVEYVFDLGDGTLVTQAEPVLHHAYATSGTYAATVTVTDDDGSSITSDALTLTVNARPVLGAIGNQIVNEAETLSITLTATDAESDALTYALAPLPSGATLDANTGAFSWTPAFDQTGNYLVTATVTDGLGEDSEEFYISVGNVNRPPVLSGIGDIFGAENSLLSFAVTGSDPDLETLTFSAAGLPAGATLHGATGAFSWTPTFNQAGDHTVTFAVTDGDIVDTETVTIHIANVDRIPTLAALAPRSIQQLNTISIPLVATDADGDVITFAATGADGLTIVDSGNGHATLRFTPTLDQLGAYTITVYANAGGATVTRTTVITVLFNTGLAALHESSSFVSGSPGEVVTIVARFTNTGPQTDTFTLGFGMSALWKHSDIPASITLASGESRLVSVDVTIPSDLAISYATISATSVGNTSVMKSARFRLDVPVLVEITQFSHLTNAVDVPKGVVRVTHLDGTPAVGAQVTVTRMHLLVGGQSRTSENGTANADGNYAFDFSDEPKALIPGEHQLVIVAKKPGGFETTRVTRYNVGPALL